MPYHQVAPPPSLSGLLSVERMGTFERLARQQSATALELYVLDVELSSAFMADLALAEVILRNAMNDQLSAYFGARWYRLDHLFDKRSRAAIKRAWRDGKCADDAPPGKLIAQLTLGFWVNLLDSGGRADQPRTTASAPTTTCCGGPACDWPSPTAPASAATSTPSPNVSTPCATGSPTTNP